jgi:nucleoid DNA-binding protein
MKRGSARTARNPRDGRPVTVERKSFPFFTVGIVMRRRLNPPPADEPN